MTEVSATALVYFNEEKSRENDKGAMHSNPSVIQNSRDKRSGVTVNIELMTFGISLI